MVVHYIQIQKLHKKQTFLIQRTSLDRKVQQVSAYVSMADMQIVDPIALVNVVEENDHVNIHFDRA